MILQTNQRIDLHNLTLHTHDENHFHTSHKIVLAFGTHTILILSRDKNRMKFLEELRKSNYKDKTANPKKILLHTSLSFFNRNIYINSKF